MRWEIAPASRLDGEVRVPGDKSIAHRALLLAALADGESTIDGIPPGADVASTAHCLSALGVGVSFGDGADGVARVSGVGLDGLREPSESLDCGNSGTTMRLLAGILGGQRFSATMDGDRSLRRRPMRRIAEPLTAMGARVESSSGQPPLRITGAPLRGVTYRPPVASAQVKSCVLLAGLYADAPTTVVEPLRTRDHTERMLATAGAVIARDASAVTVQPRPVLSPLAGRIPGDASSAAYWLVAGTLIAGADLRLPGVGVNPTRTAIVDLLVEWGARIDVVPAAAWGGEPVADLRVRGSAGRLRGGRLGPSEVPGLVDELPLLALLAPFTEQGVEIRGADELRVKESDRIATTCAALRALGARVDEFPDGLFVPGRQRLRGGTVQAAGDHRVALGVAAVAVGVSDTVRIEDAEAAAVSYAGFGPLLAELSG